MKYTLLIAVVLAVNFVLHLFCRRALYSDFGGKKTIKEIPAADWLWLVLPALFILCGIPSLWRWDTFPSVGLNVVTISIVLMLIIEYVKWQATSPAMDATLEMFLRRVWLDVQSVPLSTVGPDEIAPDFLSRVASEPHRFAAEVFHLPGVPFKTIVGVYADYLESIGHVRRENEDDPMLRQLREASSRSPIPMIFFLTVSGNDDYASLHQVMHDAERGRIYFLSDVKEITVA